MAWLLLLLDKGESYGWALFGELRDRGISVEQSLAYRDLRELEREGMVTSRWKKSGVGPQRRFYRLTASGRRALGNLAATVGEAWAMHVAFVRAREQTDDPRPREAATAADGLFAADEPSRARPGPELRAAWLLLLLAGRASYGYELRHELDGRDVHIDPATLYRLLRKLEHTGWLESRWMNPAAGPRRRLYRVTAAGRRNLDELAERITQARDAHGDFLRAYRGADGGSGA